MIILFVFIWFQPSLLVTLAPELEAALSLILWHVCLGVFCGFFACHNINTLNILNVDTVQSFCFFVKLRETGYCIFGLDKLNMNW
jgi:hypothetical protein